MDDHCQGLDWRLLQNWKSDPREWKLKCQQKLLLRFHSSLYDQNVTCILSCRAAAGYPNTLVLTENKSTVDMWDFPISLRNHCLFYCKIPWPMCSEVIKIPKDIWPKVHLCTLFLERKATSEKLGFLWGNV